MPHCKYILHTFTYIDTIRVTRLQITTTPYSFLRRVTLRGNCGPLCSSPATARKTIVRLNFLISRPSSGRENLNCLMSVTKNVCISMTLSAGKNQAISFDSFLFDRRAKHGAYTNLHPMQPLGPPEKVELYPGTSIHCTGDGYSSILLTGSRKPRNVIQVLRSFPATALVGIHRRRVPTCPCY